MITTLNLVSTEKYSILITVSRNTIVCVTNILLKIGRNIKKYNKYK